MKKHEIIFSTIRVPIDFCIVFGSFFIAQYIRWNTDGIPFLQLPTQTIDTSILALFALFGWVLLIGLFSIHGLYSKTLSSSKIKDFLEIIQYSAYWVLFFSFFIYAGNGIIYDTELPRLIILFTALVSLSWMLISRIILNKVQSFLIHKWSIKKNNLILVIGKHPTDMQNIFNDIEQAGIYDILWYIHPEKIDDIRDFKYLWDEQTLLSLLQKYDHGIDEILHIENDDTSIQLQNIAEIASIGWIRYRYIPHTFDLSQTRTHVSLIHAFPSVEILHEWLTMWWRVWKRVFDMVFSLIAWILFIPFFICIGLLIKREDPSGPIIYKNTRVGQNGKTFTLYKLRYLKWKYCIKDSYGVKPSDDSALEYEQNLIQKQSSRTGPLYKIANDPRKTKIGTWIERYSIDELPQLWNVFRWDMSLVGPRPHQPREVEKYDLKDTSVLTMKPWITGMAQVHGRDNNSFETEVKLDIFYRENWSYALDLKILLKTLAVILKR